MEKIDKVSFNHFISEGQKVVEFIAGWCVDCKRIAFSMPAWEEEYTSFRFGEIDVDEAREIAESRDVKGVPTFIAFRDGREIGRLHSKEAKKEENIEAFLDRITEGVTCS
ncbi:thioredoxin family protein [Paludifilum halophilum]|uniref:thioredoxin family protein n=1 Tax=Paludifilum halophilum TaxID=1642702 RepID=UPI00146D9456|nr:thioredoxin family protein [Paludifilum halophilum]